MPIVDENELNDEDNEQLNIRTIIMIIAINYRDEKSASANIAQIFHAFLRGSLNALLLNLLSYPVNPCERQ